MRFWGYKCNPNFEKVCWRTGRCGTLNVPFQPPYQARSMGKGAATIGEKSNKRGVPAFERHPWVGANRGVVREKKGFAAG